MNWLSMLEGGLFPGVIAVLSVCVAIRHRRLPILLLALALVLKTLAWSPLIHLVGLKLISIDAALHILMAVAISLMAFSEQNRVA